MDRPHTTAYCALTVAILAWGLEYPLMKTATMAVGVFATGAVMFSVAAVSLAASLGTRGLLRCDRLPPARSLALMLTIGGIGGMLNAAALLAARYTTVTNVATLARTDVLFSLLLSAVIFREAIDRAAWLATPVMLAGICVLTGFFGAPGPGQSNLGDALILFSAFLVALNAYLIRRATQHIDPTVVGFVATAVNAVLFLTLTIILAPPGAMPAGLATAFTHPVPLMLGGLCALFFASYYTALRGLPVWRVRLLMLLIPLVAALAGYGWSGERMTGGALAGMGLICIGAASIILAKGRSSWRHTVKPVGAGRAPASA